MGKCQDCGGPTVTSKNGRVHHHRKGGVDCLKEQLAQERKRADDLLQAAGDEEKRANDLMLERDSIARQADELKAKTQEYISTERATITKAQVADEDGWVIPGSTWTIYAEEIVKSQENEIATLKSENDGLFCDLSTTQQMWACDADERDELKIEIKRLGKALIEMWALRQRAEVKIGQLREIVQDTANWMEKNAGSADHCCIVESGWLREKAGKMRVAVETLAAIKLCSAKEAIEFVDSLLGTSDLPDAEL